MISIIIPAYNEEKRIAKTLDELQNFFKKKNCEIIVSANGCKDRTANIVKKYSAKSKNIKLISSSIAGKGLALQRGFNHCKGDIVCFADADNSSKPKDIWRLVEKLQDYDVVIGSRAVKELIEIRQPLKRELFGKLMSLIVRVLFWLPIKDTQCGYKAFKRTVLDAVFNSVKSKGFEFDVELLVRIRRAGFSINELPIKWDDDKRSTLKLFPDSVKMFYNILKLRIIL